MRNRGRNRQLSQSEEELWRRVVARVEPLPGRGAVPAVQASRPDKEPNMAHGAYAGGGPEPPPDPRPDPKDHQKKSTKHSAIDRRTAQRLKRGQLLIEGRLDLHGMTQKQAYRALLQFVTASRGYGRRVVLVVTGKGWNPDAEHPREVIGVLRRNVPRWLEAAPFTEHVVAVRDAHIRHGGSGALYVMLRQSRRPKP